MRTLGYVRGIWTDYQMSEADEKKVDELVNTLGDWFGDPDFDTFSACVHKFKSGFLVSAGFKALCTVHNIVVADLPSLIDLLHELLPIIREGKGSHDDA